MRSDLEPLMEIDLPLKAWAATSDEETEPLKLWAAKRVGMTLNQFTSFAAVAKHQSLTKASAELRVSQPSITQQLKQLEDHHGTQLYRRLSKGIEITEAGHAFLRRIIPILERVAKLESECDSPAAKAKKESLKIGGTFGISERLLPCLLARFREKHPNAALEMRTRTSDQLEALVATAVLDLAVTVRAARSSALAWESLRREKIVMFVPANHRLAQKSGLRLSDVLVEPVVFRGGKGASGVIDKALKQIRDQGAELKIGMQCDGPTAVKAAVRQNMGVGIVYEDAVEAEVASGEFKILKVCGLELEGESFIVYPKKRPLSPLVQEFLELLRGMRTGNQELDSTLDEVARPKRRSDYPFVWSPPVVERQPRPVAR